MEWSMLESSPHWVGYVALVSEFVLLFLGYQIAKRRWL